MGRFRPISSQVFLAKDAKSIEHVGCARTSVSPRVASTFVADRAESGQSFPSSSSQPLPLESSSFPTSMSTQSSMADISRTSNNASSSLPFRAAPSSSLSRALTSSPHHHPTAPSLTQCQDQDAAASMKMDDDGAMLAELLKRQDRMREQAISQMPGEGGHGSQDQVRQVHPTPTPAVKETQSSEDLSQRNEESGRGRVGSRRAQAIKYLESIPLTFLRQISTSLKSIHARNSSPSKSGIKRKKKINGEEENQRSQDAELEKAAKAEMGITMNLRNRKTGQDQITIFPDNPLSSDAREPALHRMACIMRVASLLLEAIVTETTTTKRYHLPQMQALTGRDIYYKDVALFKSQYVVDKLVDDIVASAGLKRQDFYVTATSKGLIASSALEVTLKSGGKLSFSSANASLIPPIERIKEISAPTGLEWVLIVEKDAVFQTLLSSGLLDDERLGPGVLITGKGYPDLATLQLIHRIAIDFPNAAICVLVDADPHGLDILSVYTYGSKATTYSHDYVDLALWERVNWIGVTTEDWQSYGVEYDRLLPLTDKDVQKAMAMLRNASLPPAWRRELSRMLHLNRKAEIQILSSISPPADDNLNGEEVDHMGFGGVRKNALAEYVIERVWEAVQGG